MMPEPVYHRPDYAAAMADQLLRPNALQLQVRSGVFLSGIRRTGKTTFLRQDLIPALEARGALVIYVDLWADRSKSPAALVHDAVRPCVTLADIQALLAAADHPGGAVHRAPQRQRAPAQPRDAGIGAAFPWAELATEGALESQLATEAAVAFARCSPSSCPRPGRGWRRRPSPRLR